MSEPRWKLAVDQRLCHSSGLCASIAGDRFELTPRGSRPVQEEIAADDDVLAAAECCPLQAIGIWDAADGSVIMPEPV